jgi:hypothetical protein
MLNAMIVAEGGGKCAAMGRRVYACSPGASIAEYIHMEGLPKSGEITNAEIPLEARISFADFLGDHSEWMNATAIAEMLGTYDNRISRMVDTLNIPSERRTGANGKEIAFYPPYTAAVLSEEIVWRAAYRELPSLISLQTIQEHVGRSYGWTQKVISELGAQADKMSRYPKATLAEVRRISMAVPLDDGWYNLGQLTRYTSADREWVERRLGEIGILPESRRSSLTGKILLFYPPESVGELMKAIESRAQPGGEWLTAHAITERVDRSYNWVRARLQEHSSLAVKKQDDQGVTRSHYSPNIVSILAEESKRLRALPERDEHLNVHEVARRLGHATAWAVKILDKMGIEPEETKDRLGRRQKSYDIAVLDQIREFEESYPPEAQTITPEDLLPEIFLIGSLRSRIALQRKIIETCLDNGSHPDDIFIEEARNKIRELSRELKTAKQRHRRTLDRADFLPDFIAE